MFVSSYRISCQPEFSPIAFAALPQSSSGPQLFQANPDLTPYTAKQNLIPLDEFNPKRSALHGAALHDAVLSAQMDFSVADAADDGVLNLILWHATKGYKTPYPQSNERKLGKD